MRNHHIMMNPTLDFRAAIVCDDATTGIPFRPLGHEAKTMENAEPGIRFMGY